MGHTHTHDALQQRHARRKDKMPSAHSECTQPTQWQWSQLAHECTSVTYFVVAAAQHRFTLGTSAGVVCSWFSGTSTTSTTTLSGTKGSIHTCLRARIHRAIAFTHDVCTYIHMRKAKKESQKQKLICWLRRTRTSCHATTYICLPPTHPPTTQASRQSVSRSLDQLPVRVLTYPPVSSSTTTAAAAAVPTTTVTLHT